MIGMNKGGGDIIREIIRGRGLGTREGPAVFQVCSSCEAAHQLDFRWAI